MEKYPTLLMIHLPTKETKHLLCRTPASLSSNESVIVYESETGWSTTEDNAPNSPIPPGHRLRLLGAADIKGPFGNVLKEAPWIVYVEAVP